MSGLVIVGTDGSAPAAAAVGWAADDAVRKRAELRIVHALDRGPYAITGVAVPAPYVIAGADVPELDEALRRAAAKVLEEAEAVARARQPEVPVTTRVVDGTPAAVLMDQARDADDLVVGDRGLGGFTRALLGSVTMKVAGQAPCPVVVVRDGPVDRTGDRTGERTGGSTGEIAVGVDGSESCEPAIAYAFEQAALRGATLHLVHAWEVPVHAFAPEISYDADEVRAARQELVRARTERWQAAHPEVPTVMDIRCAHPVDALTTTPYDLVVVGSHGRGAIGALLLGSVSRGVLHHARGTVAVVRPPA
ncbi:universal stress protein [Nonomuraea sp. NPDC004580]|uniref:universal stress protein n=1 Tax=Nonomuraea sp. NPDC004580 TaxID=3154552 RepID=UPI0033AD8C4B